MDGYIFPVYSTKACPKNKAEWLRRSFVLNCTARNGYMCIPNEHLTALVEFCYNVHKVAIPKGKKHGSIMKYKIKKINELYKITHKPFNWCRISFEFQIKVYMFVSIAGFCLFLTKRSSAVNAYNCRSFSYGCPNSSYFSNLLYGRKRTLILNTIIASGKNQSVALVDMICMIWMKTSFDR